MYWPYLDDPAAGLYRGLERWDRWLQEKLSPASVMLSPWEDAADEEFLWLVEFPLGERTIVRVPRAVVEANPAKLQRPPGREADPGESGLHIESDFERNEDFRR